MATTSASLVKRRTIAKGQILIGGKWREAGDGSGAISSTYAGGALRRAWQG